MNRANELQKTVVTLQLLALAVALKNMQEEDATVEKEETSTSRRSGVLLVTFEYDSSNRLINDSFWTYVYDAGGNITSKTNIRTGVRVVYTYDTVWRDRLVTYGGQTINYDGAGNPTNWIRGITNMQWQNGRQLSSLTVNGVPVSYEYDFNGIRTRKTVNGVRTDFFVMGDRVIAEQRGNDFIFYLYDETGIYGMQFRGETYFFEKNILGDVIAIYNSRTGMLVGRYTYDAWGRHLAITPNTAYPNAMTVLNTNPFRYRGYYFDTETGLYYLNSRFYCPQVRRFISPDDPFMSMMQVGMGASPMNLYSYALNNPVMFYDPTGYLAFLIPIAAKVIVGAVVGAAGGAVIYTGVEAVSWAITGEWNWNIDGLASSMMWGGAGGAVLGAVGGTVHAIRGAQVGARKFTSTSSLNSHFLDHGRRMGFANANQYLAAARHTITHGTKIRYMYKGKMTTGYIRFLGQGGGANYAFVGMRGGKIATFGPRSVSELRRMGVSWLF